MAFIAIIIGMILGGMILESPGGAIFGGVLGYLIAQASKLSQRLLRLENQQSDLQDHILRLQRKLEDGLRERRAEKSRPEEAVTISEPQPEVPQEMPGDEVPPATPIAPEPVVIPAAPTPAEPVVTQAAEAPPREVDRQQPAAEPAVPHYLQELAERWILRGNPLVKIGGVVLFLGLAFALRYAAELGLLPLWLRYSAVAATGIALLAMGWRWRDREDNYGLILQGIGLGILYLTTLAAMKLHPLLPLGIGFVLLVLVAAAAATLAVTEDAMILAVVAALGGFAAPVLASTGAGNHILLFSYLTVLNLGIVAIAWFKRWRVLNILGYICSFGLGGTWAAEHYRDELFWSTEPFLLLLFGIYVLITVLFARRTLADVEASEDWTLGEHLRKTSNQVRYVDGSLAFGVPFSAFWVQHLLVEPFAYGTAISAVGFALFYFALAYLLVKGAGRRFLLLNETLVALGAVFGTLSIPLLETPWTASAWAIEAAGVYWIGVRQRQLHVRMFALLVLLGAAVFFLPELRWVGGDPVLDGPVLSAVLMAGSTGFVYWLMWRAGAEVMTEYERGLQPIVGAFGAAMLATLPLLLLEAAWAGATLAIIGVGLVHVSRSIHDRALLGAGWLYQAAGGLMVAGVAAQAGSIGAVAFFNDGFITPLVVALAGLTCGYLMHRDRRNDALANGLGWLGIGWGGLWWAFAWVTELDRVAPDSAITASLIAVTLLSAWVCSLVARRVDWPHCGQAALAYLVALVLLGLRDLSGSAAHPGEGWGAIAWPAALLVHGLLLKARLAMIERRLLEGAHSIGVWLFIMLGSFEIHWWMQQWFPGASVWPLLGTMLLPTVYIWGLGWDKARKRWPYSDFFDSYALTGAFPLVVFLLIWLWVTNATSTGAAPPLPYIPILNPLELGYMAILGGVFLWWRIVEQHVPAGFDKVKANWLLAATAFAAVTGGVIRTCHHWAGVSWNTSALFASDTVQASLSIVWGTLAISLMLFGNRSKQRHTWLIGASLVAVVVIKLFLVELSAVGTLQRIVSFVVVGLLLLLVGYFAPLPPKENIDKDA